MKRGVASDEWGERLRCESGWRKVVWSVCGCICIAVLLLLLVVLLSCRVAYCDPAAPGSGVTMGVLDRLLERR